MDYPVLFKDTQSYFDFPEFFLCDDIPVLFLLKTSRARRDEIMQTIRAADFASWPEDIKARGVEPVPWVRNRRPNTDAALRQLDEYNGAERIFIDEDGERNGTCIVGTMVKEMDDINGEKWHSEFARVKLEEALYLVSCERARRFQSLFPNIVSEDFRVIMPPSLDEAEGTDSEWQLVGRMDQWKLPAHIPSNLRLDVLNPTILSLYHLTPDKLEELRAKLGTDEVQIINWPADTEPASETDIWRIFGRIKADCSADYSPTYGFFIDCEDINGRGRTPELIMFESRTGEVKKRGSGIDSEDMFRQENFISGRVIKKSNFTDAWEAAFSTPGSRRSEAIRQVQTLDWHTWISYFIGNPDIAAVIDDIPVFVLQKITATQERRLRCHCRANSRQQIVHVPGADGTFKSLMKWFQSPDFMHYNRKPPTNFVVADERTAAGLSDSGAGEEPLTVLLATTAYIWYEGDGASGTQLGSDEVGYQVGRVSMEGEYGWDEWIGACANGTGLNRFIEEAEYVVDQEGTGRFYWDCFDPGDQELEDLVTIME